MLISPIGGGGDCAGKSLFIYCVMWRLVRAAPAVNNLQIIVDIKVKDAPTVRYYFHPPDANGIRVHEGGPSDFLPQLKDPDAYYLVDGAEPYPKQAGRRARTLENSSDSPELYSKYKGENKTITLIMPIWKFVELRAAREVIYTNVTAAKLKQNYAVAGGSIRLALSKQHFDDNYDVKDEVGKAVGRCDIPLTLRTEGQSGKSKGVSDLLIHYIVQDEATCRKAVYDFASG